MTNQQISSLSAQKRPIQAIFPQEFQDKLRSKQDLYYYLDKNHK